MTITEILLTKVLPIVAATIFCWLNRPSRHNRGNRP